MKNYYFIIVLSLLFIGFVAGNINGEQLAKDTNAIVKMPNGTKVHMPLYDNTIAVGDTVNSVNAFDGGVILRIK